MRFFQLSSAPSWSKCQQSHWRVKTLCWYVSDRKKTMEELWRCWFYPATQVTAILVPDVDRDTFEAQVVVFAFPVKRQKTCWTYCVWPVDKEPTEARVYSELKDPKYKLSARGWSFDEVAREVRGLCQAFWLMFYSDRKEKRRKRPTSVSSFRKDRLSLATRCNKYIRSTVWSQKKTQNKVYCEPLKRPDQSCPSRRAGHKMDKEQLVDHIAGFANFWSLFISGLTISKHLLVNLFIFLLGFWLRQILALVWHGDENVENVVLPGIMAWPKGHGGRPSSGRWGVVCLDPQTSREVL